jgi:protein tyrosine phosphatase (PTP) superfamily phosphohydrolase (DUF442 family)
MQCDRPWWRRFRTWRWRLVLALLVLTALASWLVPRILDNFDVVIPGYVYRSAQLTPAALEHYTGAYGLRSIVNLRGSNQDCQWYWDERATAARLGLKFYDIGVDSRYLYHDEMREVIEALETCPRPVLFHCNSGVDRTGTVAAIAILLLEDNGTLARAEEGFGLLHLQLPWRNNAISQRRFLDLYRQWLSQYDLAHSRAAFRRWALDYYERPADEPPYSGER